MPIFVSLCHVLQDLHKILVGRLDCAIHLRPIRRGLVMLDLEALEVVLDPLGYEVSAVIKDDSVRDPILGDDVISDELLCSRGADCLV